MNVTEILEKLVSFPVLGGESNINIITWIKEYIESYDIETTMVPNEDGTKASLHCRIGPAIDGGFILSGHTDVVPVKGQDWSTNPFELIEKEGKLYGRGSADMKGFLACCLAMLPEMIKANLKQPIYFAFSYDEEIGCIAAPELAEHIKMYYQETPKYAIIGEPSLLQPIIAKKGVCYLKTEVNGTAGHSSGIHKEVSAIHESAKLIIWLEKKLTALSNGNVKDNRFTPPHSTVHVGQIHGGIATNVVSDYTNFEWDVRVIPQDNINDIFDDYFTYCKEREHEVRQKFPDFTIKNTLLHPPVPALNTDENDEIVKITQNITGNHTWGIVSYAAEAGQFQEAGFESIICGPGSIEQAHRADEFIEIEQLNKGVEMIKNLIKELSK